MGKGIRAILLCAFWCSLAAVSGWGHGTGYEVLNSGVVGIRAFFDTGDVMVNARVLIFAPGEVEVSSELRTDRNGVVAFCPDRAGLWILQIRDESGHGMRVNLDVEEGQIMATAARPVPGQLTLSQKMLVALAVCWGFIGTALFVRSRAGSRKAGNGREDTKKNR